MKRVKLKFFKNQLNKKKIIKIIFRKILIYQL